MTAEERKRFVEQLTADFRTAKESNSQDVAVWMGLACRYIEIGANMNFVYCVERAQACPPRMVVSTDLGMAGQSIELTLVPVAVETE